MTGDPCGDHDVPGRAAMGEVMRAAAASLYALLLWFAEHEIEEASQLRWRSEAGEVLTRCAVAETAPQHEQCDLFVEFIRREDELVGLDR